MATDQRETASSSEQPQRSKKQQETHVQKQRRSVKQHGGAASGERYLSLFSDHLAS